MGQGTGDRKPGHFIYTACCLDIRRLEENPKLISQYGERIKPSNLPDPNSINADLSSTAPKIARTADEAKGLCEEAERRNHLPAAIETKSANDVAPRTADDGLDIPEFLGNRAMTARVLVSNRNGTAGSTYGHHRPEHAMKIITADQRLAEKCGAK